MARRWEYDEFGGPEQLHLREFTLPAPGPDEVRIRPIVVGVNPIDRTTMAGRFPWVPRPHVPGAEATGTVTAVGPRVTTPRPGDTVAISSRLFCGRCDRCLSGEETQCRESPDAGLSPQTLGVSRPGSWSEGFLVPARNTLPIPDGLTAETAAPILLDGGVAWHLVSRLRPEAGETALVVGAAGGVGTFATQILALRGVEVFAVSDRPAAAPVLRELGATEVLPRKEIAERVGALTHGAGVSIIVDPTGSDLFPTDLAALAPGGRIGTCGITSGAQASLDLLRLYARELSVIGSTGARRSDVQDVLALAARGRVRARVDRTHPFEEAPAAFATLARPDRVGKVMLALSPS